MKNKYDELLNDTTPKRLKTANNTIYWMCFALIALAILLVIVFGTLITKIENEKIEQQKQMQIDKNIELSYPYALIGKYCFEEQSIVDDSLLYNLFVEAHAWYPDVLVAQAKLESANYNSNIYAMNNNLYGMKLATRRNHTQFVVSNNGYGKYANWKMSALDRVLWDHSVFRSKPKKNDYINSLSIYAEDTSYVDKIKYMIYGEEERTNKR